MFRGACASNKQYTSAAVLTCTGDCMRSPPWWDPGQMASPCCTMQSLTRLKCLLLNWSTRLRVVGCEGTKGLRVSPSTPAASSEGCNLHCISFSRARQFQIVPLTWLRTSLVKELRSIPDTLSFVCKAGAHLTANHAAQGRLAQKGADPYHQFPCNG